MESRYEVNNVFFKAAREDDPVTLEKLLADCISDYSSDSSRNPLYDACSHGDAIATRKILSYIFKRREFLTDRILALQQIIDSPLELLRFSEPLADLQLLHLNNRSIELFKLSLAVPGVLFLFNIAMLEIMQVCDKSELDNIKAFISDTVLHFACSSGDLETVAAVLDTPLRININVQNGGGTPLHISLKRHDLGVTRLLLTKGATLTLDLLARLISVFAVHQKNAEPTLIDDLCFPVVLSELVMHQQYPCLTNLNLSNRGLGDIDVRNLSEVLKSNSTIRKLVLARNKLTASSMSILGDLLKHNTPLMILDMQANLIAPPSLLSVIPEILKDEDLIGLDEDKENDWSRPSKSYLGLTNFITGLKHNHNLVKIDFKGCGFNDSNIQKFITFFKSPHGVKLKKVEFDDAMVALLLQEDRVFLPNTEINEDDYLRPVINIDSHEQPIERKMHSSMRVFRDYFEKNMIEIYTGSLSVLSDMVKVDEKPKTRREKAIRSAKHIILGLIYIVPFAATGIEAAKGVSLAVSTASGDTPLSFAAKAGSAGVSMFVEFSQIPAVEPHVEKFKKIFFGLSTEEKAENFVSCFKPHKYLETIHKMTKIITQFYQPIIENLTPEVAELCAKYAFDHVTDLFRSGLIQGKEKHLKKLDVNNLAEEAILWLSYHPSKQIVPRLPTKKGDKKILISEYFFHPTIQYKDNKGEYHVCRISENKKPSQTASRWATDSELKMLTKFCIDAKKNRLQKIHTKTKMDYQGVILDDDVLFKLSKEDLPLTVDVSTINNHLNTKNTMFKVTREEKIEAEKQTLATPSM